MQESGFGSGYKLSRRIRFRFMIQDIYKNQVKVQDIIYIDEPGLCSGYRIYQRTKGKVQSTGYIGEPGLGSGYRIYM